MPFSYFELTAALLSLAGVALAVRRRIATFPVGIASVLAYALVFFQARLYSDMLLQLAYVGFQVHGWIAWSRGPRANDQRIAVRRAEPVQWLTALLVFASGTVMLGSGMHSFTDADLPYLDAALAVGSMITQVWSNKKFLENWMLWMVIDLVYLYQYTYKELYVTTGLYAVFLLLAADGWRQWKKHASSQGFQQHQHQPHEGLDK